MSIYLSRTDGPPDSEFEAGELHHLVVGNRGRLLDPRRTPVSIVGVRPELGFFDVQIDDFEDAGARWSISLEKVRHYQFARGSERAASGVVVEFRAAIARFDRRVSIACAEEPCARTDARLDEATRAATGWFESHSRFFAGGGRLPDPTLRRGDERLYHDLGDYLESRGVGDMESAFARQFVSNPYSGELVKGHRIVIAELGLVPYEGEVVRDPALFEDAWSRERRADHIINRLAFVRALWGRLECRRVVLHRGISSEDPLTEPENHTFVSATFDEAVARSHYDSGTEHATRVLMRQAVSVERIFMTYLETAAMNEQFREAEAVLLYDARARPF